MAIYTGFGANLIYQQADNFRENCLNGDGSILFQDADVWSVDALKALHNALTTVPEEMGLAFLGRLKAQLDTVTGEAEWKKKVTRLAAEVLCVYFLFPSNVGGVRKRQVVNEVLDWVGDKLPDSDPVLAAFAKGIGSGGQGYNTHRHLEIAFLIDCVIKWKERPQDAAGPNDEVWTQFQELVDNVTGAKSRQLRHMLLHLLFPEHFERMASSDHKSKVIKAFSGLVDQNPADIDNKIWNIRLALAHLLEREHQELDFYTSPLVEAWYDDSEGASEDTPLEIIQHKKQIVLYGPPGTGKTFRAKKLAERVIRSAALSRMGPALYFQSQPAIESAIRDNVHRLQLHPAYSYEDFIRALHISDGGRTEYRPGYLPKLIEDIEQQPCAKPLPHILILDEMNRTDLSRMLGECFSLLEDRNQTIELPARNGDGAAMKLRIPDDLYVIGTMNLIDQSIEQIDFALRRRFLWLLCPFDAEALVGAAKSKWEALNSGVEWACIEPDFRKLAAAAAALNKQIHDSPLLGSQYEIGHTYLLDVVVFLRNFLDAPPAGEQNYLWDKKGEALKPVEQVWNLSLRPLLEQYLAGLDANARTTELDRLSKVLLKPVAVEAE